MNKDLFALQDYTKLIKSGVVPEKATEQTLQNVSTSLQAQILLYGDNINALDQLIVKQKQAAASAKASQIAMQGLYAIGGSFASWALNEALQFAVTSLNNYIHRVEIASQKTKDAIQSYNAVSSEIDTLNSRLTELTQEMKELNPATDSEELDLLKQETEELSLQVALLKEKQFLSEDDADQTAQKSLSMEQDSLYDKTETYNNATGVLMEIPVKVTKSEELLNAIKKYDEYAASIEEAEKAQQELAAQGSYSKKEWDRQEQVIQNLSERAQDVRAHANALALEIEEQRQGLNGDTEASLKLIQKTDSAMRQYLNWLPSIQTSEGGQIETEPEEQNLSPVSLSLTEVLTNLNALTSGFEKLKAIYADIQDQETFNFSSLAGEDFTEIFGSLDSYESFINTIVNSSDNLENCQEAFNQLVTEWLNTEAPLEGMTEGAKNVSKALLEQFGIANAEETVMAALGMAFDDYAAAKQEAADAGVDLYQATDGEIQHLINESLVSKETAASLFYYQLQKALASENGISTAEDCSNLLALAENAGITGDIIEDLIRLEQIYQEVSKGTMPITKMENLLAEADSLTASIKSQAANFKTAKDPAQQYASGLSGLAGAQRSAASAADRYTSALDEQKAALESQKSALEKQKQYYEDVIQAVNWFYDKQIGKVQNLIDGLQKENKLLEKRKGNYDMALSSVDRFYDREIQKTRERQDAIQEKIDSLKSENEERRKSYELEKAAYELEKARNQRTDQVYVQGKGMVYVSNEDAVQEAENTYEDLLADQKVSDLEKQKADLDLTIAKLEEYRQLWADVSSSYQFAQEDMMLSQLLGATWETDLLTGRMETLSLFRDTYNGIQSEINSNEELIASYEEKIEYYQGLKDQWEELTGKYQEETYIQLLTTEFGNDYENELLNGRTGRWTKFSEEYASIQKQLKEVTDQIETLAARMESYASRMEAAANKAKDAANTINGISITSVGGNIPRHKNDPIGGGRAKGGIISQKDSNALDSLARSVGEDHLVPLQEGEAVIPKNTVLENAPIVQMLLAGELNELRMPNTVSGILAHPELQKPLEISSPFPGPTPEILYLAEPADRTTLQFYGDLSFPNIHSGDEAQKLIDELSHLSVRAQQYFNRQH